MLGRFELEFGHVTHRPPQGKVRAQRIEYGLRRRTVYGSARLARLPSSERYTQRISH